MGNQTTHPVKTVRTTFSIVETVQELDGAGISEIADALGIAKSTVHRHVSTLYDEGYLVKNDEDEYELGLRFLYHGAIARNRNPAFEIARSKVETLAEQTDERAQFMVEEHGRAISIEKVSGGQGVHTDFKLGQRVPMHATSTGKVILANLPESRVDEIIEMHGLPGITDETITDRESLFDELERVRNRGYGYNRGEYIEGLHSVAAPVFGPKDEVVGAFGISGPAHRLKGDVFEEELPDLLLGATNEVELNIMYR